MEPRGPKRVEAITAVKFLPPINSPSYHALLSAVAILVLGPLAGITAAYMNFSLGFFVGGQVLAGILGSVVTFGYGPQGRHGANYMQTMAASVASMAAMGVLAQSMIWLGLAEPSSLQLILYFLCVGMLGVGLGMLYTPIVVDRLQLTFPSGLAVANILRALTDPTLLRRSIATLGGGMATGAGLTLLAEKNILAILGSIHFSSSTFGAGILVGARVGVPALIVGLIGLEITPWLRTEGLLGPNDPWRKVGFLIALGAILGAAVIDLSLILRETLMRSMRRISTAPADHAAGERPVKLKRLAAWVAFWAAAVVATSWYMFSVPVGFAVLGVALAFVFVLINGISMGISDSNPISSAFVFGVTVMALAGLTDPSVGLIAGSILLITTVVGGDMQQDRSTGWRLGTDRTIQFRYQVIGIFTGAVLAVFVSHLFLAAYPVLRIDTFSHPELKVGNWQSAMTYKIVGVLRGLTSTDTMVLKLMALGGGIGIVTETVRKLLQFNVAYQNWKIRSTSARAADFVVHAIVVPSPYASSFGGFVDWFTTLWFALGGIFSSMCQWASKQPTSGTTRADEPLEDIGSLSLAGGGLIAGEALAFLILGVLGMLSLLR